MFVLQTWFWIPTIDLINMLGNLSKLTLAKCVQSHLIKSTGPLQPFNNHSPIIQMWVWIYGTPNSSDFSSYCFNNMPRIEVYTPPFQTNPNIINQVGGIMLNPDFSCFPNLHTSHVNYVKPFFWLLKFLNPHDFPSISTRFPMFNPSRCPSSCWPHAGGDVRRVERAHLDDYKMILLLK